jgi:serine/threonine-protein kinase HipA
MDKKGNWKFAPAYDLTFSNSSFGFHSTTVAGESRNPTLEHLKELAKHFGIKNPNPIFEEVRNSISDFNNLASNLGITKDSMKLISGSLKV